MADTFIVSNGADFTIQKLDRAYKGGYTDAFKVDGKTGVVTVAGQTISSSGVIGATGAVTATTIAASSTLTVTGAATLNGGVAITGAATVGGKTVNTGSYYSVVQAGKNGAGALTLAGATVTDVVVAVVNLTTPGDLQSSFETAITIAGQIQQSSATDLSSKQILFILHKL
jgi:hypothetical protein